MAGVSVAQAKDLVAELCSLFYNQGWVSGTGGGISVRAGELHAAGAGPPPSRRRTAAMAERLAASAHLQPRLQSPAARHPTELHGVGRCR
jgi:ribulose-5-phosphate 4-epimerase/fuculose-1-phosphate aldolase